MPFVNAGAAAAGAITPNSLDPGLLGGRVRIAQADFTFATDAIGTYVAPIRLPVGARVILHFLQTTVSLGTAQFALGIAGSIAKYRAAAVFTTVEGWNPSSIIAGYGPRLTVEEQIIMTTTVATLPASGTLRIGFLYVLD